MSRYRDGLPEGGSGVKPKLWRVLRRFNIVAGFGLAKLPFDCARSNSGGTNRPPLLSKSYFTSSCECAPSPWQKPHICWKSFHAVNGHFGLTHTPLALSQRELATLPKLREFVTQLWTSGVLVNVSFALFL